MAATHKSGNTKLQHVDTKEMLKVIVGEINKIFNEQYNLISFDTLPIENLMQLLCDVICHFGEYEKMNYKNNPEDTMFKVFQSLGAVDYVPYDGRNATMDPEVFKEKLLKGERHVVNRIIYWIVNNKEHCKKYLYLSQFMVQVPVPPELEDQDILTLRSEYEVIRSKFWKIYKENNNLKEQAEHIEELNEDIERMIKDSQHLNQRLESQKDKLEDIPQKVVFLEEAKKYRSEISNEKKLSSQYKHTTELVEQLNDMRSTLEINMESRMSGRKAYASLIPSTEQELTINKIMFSKELPMQLQKAFKELELCSVIGNEYIPHKDDLEQFEIKVQDLEAEVRDLIERKNLLTNATEDKLGPFRNQAKVISNRRAEISSQVQSIKDALVEVDYNIEEKTKLMHEIVGGNILHGNDLKAYVNNLRSQSNVYKECRLQLQTLNNELAVVARTLDILFMLDPNVENAIKNKENATNIAAVDTVVDASEIKQKYRILKKDMEQNRASFTYTKRDLTNLQEEMFDVSQVYNREHEIFEEATGNLTSQIKLVGSELKEKQDLVEELENKWKNMIQTIEEDERMIKKLNDKNLKSKDNKEDSSFVDVLKNRIQELNEGNEKVKGEIKSAKELRDMDNNQVTILHEIYNLLMNKENSFGPPIKTETVEMFTN